MQSRPALPRAASTLAWCRRSCANAPRCLTRRSASAAPTSTCCATHCSLLPRRPASTGCSKARLHGVLCCAALQRAVLCRNVLDCVATWYTVLQPGVAGLNVLIEGASAAAAAVPHCWSGRHLRHSHWLSRTCSERGVCAYRNRVGPQRAEHTATVGEAQPIRGWTAWHRRVGWLQQAELTSPAHVQARVACVCMCWLQRRVHSAPSTERR